MARKSRQNRYFPEKTESKWKRLGLCTQYATSPKLTGELLDSLIDRIVIYADKRICVHFRYNGECYPEVYSGRC